MSNTTNQEHLNTSTKLSGDLAKIGPYEISFMSDIAPFKKECYIHDTGVEGLYEITYNLSADTPTILPEIFLKWSKPMVDSHLRWITKLNGANALKTWRMASTTEAMATRGAPVYSIMSQDGTNQLTFALSDALNKSHLRAQVLEEDGCLNCEIIMHSESRATRTNYSLTVLFDMRPIPYYESLAWVSDWWAKFPGYEPMNVPENARLPMYSTWYSFHLGITPEAIEEQCRLAKPLGMDSVIVDDGWQTEDKKRGYSWCGDWDVATKKFPDFAGHVKRIQDMGVKYLLWFSVPFVGIHTEAYQKFKDCLLSDNPKSEWWNLDPRYPEVRKYLCDKYLHYVKEYNIDGLKLDFVDAFADPATEPSQVREGRENISVPEAAAKLLSEVADILKAEKPDIMLEFRQGYIGPIMRRCGNIFRVGDVPNEIESNRINGIDLRSLSGNTAVHSDMIMWHPTDSDTSVSLQLLNNLFTVPQISVKIDKLTDNHKKILTHYLKFWKENREVILDGKLSPIEPGMKYIQVHAQTSDKFLAAVFGKTEVTLPTELPSKIFFVNGSLNSHIVVSVPKCDNTKWTLKKIDALGNLVSENNTFTWQDIQKLDIEPAGLIVLEKN